MFSRSVCAVAVCAATLLAAPPESAGPESAGLIAHWTFDRSFASSVNNGFYAGVPHGGARARIDRTAGAARVGEGALRLSSASGAGKPAYVAVANPPWGLDGNNVLTIAGWFKLSDAGRDGMDPRNFVWESVPNSSLVFSLATTPGGKAAQFRFRSENYRSFQQTTGGPVLSSDAWHHVATVWNTRARYIRVFLDGKLHREMPLKDANGLEAIRGLHLGGNKLGDGAADWDGWLDDIAIFDVELTARQIAALAQGGEISAANVLTRVPESDAQRIAQGNRALRVPEVPALEKTSQGPFIGHVGEADAILWARTPHAGVYTLTAKAGDGHTVTTRASAKLEHDWTLHWRLPGLKPRTSYTATFTAPSGSGLALKSLTFLTAPKAGDPAKVALSFGSCVDFGPNPIWARIAGESPDGFVMLGDTPYIDTTKLDAMRWAYRRFVAEPTLTAMLQRIPFWGTWDDHDYGANAADGTMPNKSISRRVFAEYRPLPSVGENEIGSYTSFRRGPVEVFLLDTRWFARAEPSWSDPSKDTLLGLQQWNWLQRSLRASTAPFKILASGMIWSNKHGDQNDAWGFYAYERDALFRWLGENRISGVVLMGGDIHISRLVRFPTRGTTGYDLTEFTTSPMHDRVNPGAAVPNPNLIASVEEPWVFLKVEVDSTQRDPLLIGELINRDGKRFFRQELKASELSRK